MSLDVWLVSNKSHEDKCSECGAIQMAFGTVYDANITHNLNKMAEVAGIYEHLWRPEELKIRTAQELIQPLKEALEKLKDRPEFFKLYDTPNGWGTYEQFVPFVENYLKACEENPLAEVRVSR